LKFEQNRFRKIEKHFFGKRQTWRYPLFFGAFFVRRWSKIAKRANAADR
jgi:hypothetical protein